jgi:hypothetical protein
LLQQLSLLGWTGITDFCVASRSLRRFPARQGIGRPHRRRHASQGKPLSVNKAGVPRQMILVGICEKCAAKDDATLLREGFAELRWAFPDTPEFKVHVVQEWTDIRQPGGQ